MGRTARDITALILITLGLTLLIWLPFLFKLPSFFGLDFSAGFNTIYKNFDGLEYVIIAKTFYRPELLAQIPQQMSAAYYASHFPGYSLLILSFAPLLGFLKSMLLVSVLFTIFSAVAFYLLVRDFKLTEHPLLLSTIFLVLPARWLIVHSVGSAETVFIFFTILSFYFFLKFERQAKELDIFLASVFGSLAILTRPPGILIFVSMILYLAWKVFVRDRENPTGTLAEAARNYFPLLLLPAMLLLVFYWYAISLNDFFAYFRSGDNIHLTLPPFSVFNKHQFWVGDIWLEDIIYVLMLGYLGAFYLLKKGPRPLGSFVLTYIVATTFVAHRDISRYSLPVFPFLLIAFERVLVSKEFRLVLVILFLGIYLYSQNFIIANTAPIPNLSPFN